MQRDFEMSNTGVAQYGKSTGYGLSAVGGEPFRSLAGSLTYDTDNFYDTDNIT